MGYPQNIFKKKQKQISHKKKNFKGAEVRTFIFFQKKIIYYHFLLVKILYFKLLLLIN